MRHIRAIIGASILLGMAGSAARAASPVTVPIVVAADGSGTFKTVQDAVNAAPTGSADKPTLIHIMPGTYKEVVYVQREKRFLHLIGDDAARTTITYDLFASKPGVDGKPLGTFRTASVTVDADDFSADNITFANSAGPVGQALAVRVDGDRVTFHHCRFAGWQDTILDNRGRHYYDGCDVRGSVDFIFGGATAVYDHCAITEIRDSGGELTAPSTPQEQAYGFVFLQCHLAGAAGVRSHSTGLMRPWRPYGMSAFIHCTMDDAIKPAGWDKWAGRETTCRAFEFGSTAPGGKPADVSARAAWSRQLSAAEAAKFVPAVLFGDWRPAGTLSAPTK